MEIVNRLCTTRALRKRIADSRNRLYGVALAWCGDAMLADDLVQETQIIALRRVHQLRDHQRLNAWLYTILSNCWKAQLRSMRPNVEYEDSRAGGDDDAESASSELEVVDRVRRAILKLPEGQRQTITLVDLAGFSYAEVAEILGIPIGTVMSRLHTSRNTLQRVLSRFRTRQPARPAYLRRVK